MTLISLQEFAQTMLSLQDFRRTLIASVFKELWHASPIDGIKKLQPSAPGRGGIGYGIYLAPRLQESRPPFRSLHVYGKHLYKCTLTFPVNNSTVLFVTPEDVVETFPGLGKVGSPHTPHTAFLLKMRNKLYSVGVSPDKIRDLGAVQIPEDTLELDLDKLGQEAESNGYRAVYMEGIRSDGDEELVVFDSKGVKILEQVS